MDLDQAKRVILRLQEADMNYNDPYEPVRLYLEKMGHSLQHLDENHHFIHIQPPNPDIPQIDPKIHVVIDFETAKFSGPIEGDFPHEFYRVRREGGKLTLARYRESTWFTNFQQKILVVFIIESIM
ncbi:uncharacterized protein N7484_006736 [Penicillium longicatenatum]|uniref:uncharacterized protein n=1 Tax=Penicillium longicatenatum TaxID=1561947 RepID=UPI002548D822|nr:uncharacterized protein N7484_006736 [Penicillium longicatenatum]KAJ5644229.1 hypothetical protein N7484_006736 [Penicillium longicatenatum]